MIVVSSVFLAFLSASVWFVREFLKGDAQSRDCSQQPGRSAATSADSEQCATALHSRRLTFSARPPDEAGGGDQMEFHLLPAGTSV